LIIPKSIAQWGTFSQKVAVKVIGGKRSPEQSRGSGVVIGSA
jgi:hypothetical protein